jgi:hypothetical protein
VYVQAAYAPDTHVRRYYEAVIALMPKTLTVKDYFIIGDKPLKNAKDRAPGITPVAFSFPNRDLVLAGGRDGRLYILDSRSLGGPNHRTPVFASAALVESGGNHAGTGFRGAFSTWMNVDTGTRRFYAPVFGAIRKTSGLKPDRQRADSGFILALELAGTKDKPTLTALWASHDMLSPAPAVIANGMLFILSTGQLPRVAKPDGKPYSSAEREQLAKPARLYVLDAVTGKDLYSSGELSADAPPGAELAVANGRAYFSARDNAVYCFGIPSEQSQLVEQ